MARKMGYEYTARIQDDGGTVRGKIPSPLVREMGARPGDYMIFRMDETGNVTVSLSRTRGRTKITGGGAKRAIYGGGIRKGESRRGPISKRR